MITIETKPVKPDISVQVPGSKSYTHRTLIAAALSNGPCWVTNSLRSEDTLLTLNALRQIGVCADRKDKGILIQGRNGHLAPCAKTIHLGNSGTSIRLLSGVVALGEGQYVLTGNERMSQRPIQPLLDSLNQMNIPARSQHGNGCPPVIIEAGNRSGGHISVDCSVSSQYLSALLLIAPYLEKGLTIDITRGPVSRPYIDMTIDIMNAFGLDVTRHGYSRFTISGGQIYQCGNYTVEPDGSQAGYFWSAAAITGARVKVQNITRTSRQGDVALADVFGRMGCRVDHEPDGIAVTGGKLQAVTVDLGNMPDTAPTLAVAAAFAQGTTKILNVAHLRTKESDRLAAVVQELTKMGIEARADENTLTVTGGKPKGTEIETYDDHRIAMSFAVAGLRTPGIAIHGESCVAKSFPNYWEVFKELYQ